MLSTASRLICDPGRLRSIGWGTHMKYALSQNTQYLHSVSLDQGSFWQRRVWQDKWTIKRTSHFLWSSRPPNLLQKAAAVASEQTRVAKTVWQGEAAETGQQTEAALGENEVLHEPLEAANRVELRARATGAFQHLPMVPSGEEHIRSALRRAKNVPGNKTIKNKTLHARNLSARRLDALTKELATPLNRIIKGFPACSQLHAFEHALLDLTLGIDTYEKRLARLDSLRKSCLEVGKSYAGRASKAANMKEAYAVADDGFARVETIFRKNAAYLDAIKDAARILRKLPTVDPSVPTVALVGAPNVGKSSLVQVLSSGLPEVCNYPFTTRTIKMGHFFVDGVRHQVTDTPGLLNRNEEDRNAMERLTVACLDHLPTAAMFVVDLTGHCGTSLESQWVIRRTLRQRFPEKLWLDVFSKADLLEPVFAKADSMHDDGDAEATAASGNGSGMGSAGLSAVEFVKALPSALRISSTAELGIEQLKEKVLGMLTNAQWTRFKD